MVIEKTNNKATPISNIPKKPIPKTPARPLIKKPIQNQATIQPVVKKTIPTIIPKKPTTVATKKITPQQAPQLAQSAKKPDYKFAGKETLSQIIARVMPKEFIANEKMAAILGFIFLGVIVLALIQFPYGKLLSGDVEIVIGVGWPMHFLELGIENPDEPPVRLMGLLVDMFLYIFAAYIINVLINFAEENLLKSKTKLEKKPKVFVDKSSTIADKITQKIFSEN
jgi:hypothetical protein